MLRNKLRGVPRVDNPRNLNSILSLAVECTLARPVRKCWCLHDLLQSFRFCWRRTGVWDRIMDALTVGYDKAV
jgi:hypothetical protein